jgi:glycolate oxidase FAD binding subunit
LPSVSSVVEASDLLAAAHAEGRRLRIGDDLTTDGLSAILEHEAGDLTCTVEAGVRLSRLRTELARHGQRLSLDPPGDPTVGALLATNSSGPLRHRFGAPRDLVLGVTLVLPDGTIASAGGKVVKNVAGYDLARLVCGSRGRLALIARASFRLHPLPRSTRTLVVPTEDAAGVVSTLRRSTLEPSALDVLHPGRVALLFEGAERAVEAQLDHARTLVGGEGAALDVWDESRRRQQAARGRVRFDPGRLAEALGALGDAVVRPAPGVAFTAEENASYNLSQTPEQAALDRLLDRLEQALDPRGVLR